MLAATCSKIGSPSELSEGSGQPNAATTTVKLVGQNQVIQASDFAQLIPVQAGQTLGVLNPDGTVTQLNPQVLTAVSSAANVGTPIKGITSVANQNPNALSNATQIFSQTAAANAGIYSILQPQQLQIDGQEAIFIPGTQQAIQLSGNQLLSSPNQTVVRQQNTQQTQQSAQQTIFIPGIGNVSLGQFATAGQTVAVRQGNVVQTIQLPVQQTIPVQAISQQNGQTILQTIHLPIQAIQSLNAGNVQQLTAQVVPQMQQVLN